MALAATARCPNRLQRFYYRQRQCGGCHNPAEVLDGEAWLSLAAAAEAIRGKDAQETRFRRHLWWQANRDWLGLVASISAVIGAFVAVAHAFG